MRRQPRALIPFIGFIVWAGAFLAIYAAQNLGCRFGWGEAAAWGLSAHRLVLAAIYAAALVLIGGLILVSKRAATARPRGTSIRFLGWLALWGDVAAFAAAAVTLAPALVLSPC
ncbi:MAG: hypothetical protein ACK4NA_01920 [Alphaproteobacteria bacterium]